VEAALFFRGLVGPATITVDAMPKKTKSNDGRKQKLIQVVELLKFVLTLDDEEIMKSTIESVIELLEEENGK
jgi:hypothetical protein